MNLSKMGVEILEGFMSNPQKGFNGQILLQLLIWIIRLHIEFIKPQGWQILTIILSFVVFRQSSMGQKQSSTSQKWLMCRLFDTSGCPLYPIASVVQLVNMQDCQVRCLGFKSQSGETDIYKGSCLLMAQSELLCKIVCWCYVDVRLWWWFRWLVAPVTFLKLLIGS